MVTYVTNVDISVCEKYGNKCKKMLIHQYVRSMGTYVTNVDIWVCEKYGNKCNVIQTMLKTRLQFYSTARA